MDIFVFFKIINICEILLLYKVFKLFVESLYLIINKFFYRDEKDE